MKTATDLWNDVDFLICRYHEQQTYMRGLGALDSDRKGELYESAYEQRRRISNQLDKLGVPVSKYINPPQNV